MPKGQYDRRRRVTVPIDRIDDTMGILHAHVKQCSKDVRELTILVKKLEQSQVKLQRNIIKAMSAMLQMIHDPDAHAHAQAVAKDYSYINIPRKNKKDGD